MTIRFVWGFLRRHRSRLPASLYSKVSSLTSRDLQLPRNKKTSFSMKKLRTNWSCLKRRCIRFSVPPSLAVTTKAHNFISTPHVFRRGLDSPQYQVQRNQMDAFFPFAEIGYPTFLKKIKLLQKFNIIFIKFIFS